ncbi:hypothetical protein [Oceanivirga salmonicida]|uniref:hypothetical protein n=1 Tax=Oceanivirga salmonicida TaxID=1769291 RepID=UPI0012E13996|nr:hypothetical protein [Oceanivirga salmonicida]
MLKILKKLDENDSIDLNKQIRDLDIDNNTSLLISTYIVENNKSIIRESYEVTSQNTKISDTVLELLEHIRNKGFIDGIEDKKLITLMNRAISKSIENLKYNYSLFELIDETYIFTLEFYNLYYNNLNSEKVLDIFDVYITILQIQTQNKQIKEEHFEKMGLILYAIIQKELLKEKSLNSILKEKNITNEYYEYLHSYYENFNLDLESDYESYAKELELETNYAYSAYLFNYFETTLLIDYLELNSNKFDDTKNKKELNKVLAKISEFEY